MKLNAKMKRKSTIKKKYCLVCQCGERTILKVRHSFMNSTKTTQKNMKQNKQTKTQII